MRRQGIVPAAIVLVLAFVFFSRWQDTEDFLLHVSFMREMFNGQRTIPHPLFHVVLWILTGGDGPLVAPGVVVFLMAASLASLTWLTAETLACHSIVECTVFSVALAVVMPLQN
jgi:hypothetical protein